MKRYLVRAGFDPTKHYRPRDLLKRDYIGGNSGNMMFAYGVMNVLTTDQARCTPTYYQRYWTEEEIEYINQTYDAFLLPLADAFRDGFIPQLKAFTALMKKLTIPCIVIGVGFRGDYEPQFEAPRRVDSVAKEFVSEVLNHSSCLGLRGGITADYLSYLGFIPEKDFTVIGCPSLYMHGLSAVTKQFALPERIAVNVNANSPEAHRFFMAQLLDSMDNIQLIQQRYREFIDMYYGRAVDLKGESGNNIFPMFQYARLKSDNKVSFFLSVPSWLEQMQNYDLFIGQRFHGTAAAVLAGVPSVMIPLDSRTREMTEYHRIATLPSEAIQGSRPAVDYIQALDFNQFQKNQFNNLKHYVDFLHENSLETVFNDSMYLPFGESVMEKQFLSDKRHEQDLTCFDASASYTKMSRIAEYCFFRELKKTKQQIKKCISRR